MEKAEDGKKRKIAVIDIFITCFLATSFFYLVLQVFDRKPCTFKTENGYIGESMCPKEFETRVNRVIGFDVFRYPTGYPKSVK